MKTLMTHQIKALEYAKTKSKIALFLEMRLGKSLITLRWCKLKKLRFVLILAPKATHPSWKAELEEENLPVLIPEGKIEDRYGECENRQGMNCYILLNYEAVSLWPLFLNLAWDGIICDESTYLRNPKAKITKYLTGMTDFVPNKAILSGLPNPESSMDYFSQFKFLHGYFMNEKNFWNWRNKNCSEFGYSWEVKPKRLPIIKQEVHELAFVLTRKEAGMGSKKVYERRYVEMNSAQKKLMKQLEKDYEYDYDDDENKMTKYAPVKFLWMSRVAGGFTPQKTMVSGEKFEEIRCLLGGELKKETVIIWFRFNYELEMVYKMLRRTFRKKNIGIFMADNKQGINKDGTLNCQVMCAQEKLGKMGLPWHDSSTMVFYSNHYDYEVRAQCEDRGIHPLKKEPYLIIDLMTKDSIDEIAIDLLLEKKTQAKYFMSRLEEQWQKRT